MRRQRQMSTRLELETLEDRLTPAIGFQGGPVVAHAQVVAVFYGDYWSGAAGIQSAAQINNFLSYVVNSPFMDTMLQYGVGRGSVLGVGVIDPGLTGVSGVSDGTIQSELANDIAINRLPGASINTVYLVFTPPNVAVSSGAESSLLNSFGYHSAFAFGTTGVVNYAVIVNPVGNGTDGSLTAFQSITRAITVQLADAVTDPESNAWIDVSTGYEIGTQVDNPGNIAFLNNYVVAGLWSATQQTTAYPVGSTPPDFDPTVSEIEGANVLAQVSSAITHSLEYYDGVVETYYQEYLGRNAGQSELNFWALNLSAGNRNEEVLSQILGSNEYFGKAGGTNQDWVNQVYKDVLDRAADQGGESFWLKDLAAGASRQQVASLIDTSTEAEAAVVSTYYQTYLGRSGSSSDINYWAGILHSGVTQEQVVATILASPEYLTDQGGTLSGWVTAVYEATLHRAPDTGGFNNWIRILNVPFAS
jgi:hypothetical protein